MEHPPSDRGFTLVEMAIVILVIGLLLSALMLADEYTARARLSQTVSAVQSYASATAIFLDRYSGLPGDLRDASRRIPGCLSAAACDAPSGSPGAGDGVVGLPGAITQHQTSGAAAERETVLFWSHLALTGLIGGLAPLSAPDIAWGQTHPAAPVGGGFHVKHADGGLTHPLPGWPPLADQPSGTFVVLQRGIGDDLVPAIPGKQVLRPRDAAWIDRKLDDGGPVKGGVVAYGPAAVMGAADACLEWPAVDLATYAERSRGQDCGLAFRIAP
ncbi:MAG: type II secretion system protein [Myxococcota bacterium]